MAVLSDGTEAKRGGNMTNTVEIFFDDLVDWTKTKVLLAAGVKDPKEMNWDVIPITVLEFEVARKKAKKAGV